MNLEQGDFGGGNAVDSGGLSQGQRGNFDKFCSGLIAQSRNFLIIELLRDAPFFERLHFIYAVIFAFEISLVMGFNLNLAQNALTGMRIIRQFELVTGEGQGGIEIGAMLFKEFPNIFAFKLSGFGDIFGVIQSLFIAFKLPELVIGQDMLIMSPLRESDVGIRRGW